MRTVSLFIGALLTPKVAVSSVEQVRKRLPSLGKVDHTKFATERERIAASVDVDATNARMNEISFDFNFG